MPRYIISQADAPDDDDLRQRMREDILSGAISTTFRREPNFYFGTDVQGNNGIVLKFTDSTTGEVVAIGTRTLISAYLNGTETQIGYLCDLRGTQRVRSGSLLARGFQKLKSIHYSDPISLYYTMILSENTQAINALTGARAGLPHYRDMGKFFTPTIHLDRKRFHRFNKSLSIVSATHVPLTQLVQFINAQYKRFQIAPKVIETDLLSARYRGLQLDDIYVALRGDTIVGCVACWDQSSFKQIHVENYHGTLKHTRVLYNIFARLGPYKALPSAGERLSFFYLALIAIENDDPSVFRDLLEAVYADRRQSQWHFFIAGLHERHPLVSELRRFRHIPTEGNMYIAHWEDGVQQFEMLDERPPHFEIAAL